MNTEDQPQSQNASLKQYTKKNISLSHQSQEAGKKIHIGANIH